MRDGFGQIILGELLIQPELVLIYDKLSAGLGIRVLINPAPDGLVGLVHLVASIRDKTDLWADLICSDELDSLG